MRLRPGRVLRVMGLVISLLLAGAAGLLTWLAGSEQGLKAILNTAQTQLPGKFEYAGASGTLQEGVRLQGVHYRLGTTDLRLDSLDLKWRPRALLRGRLRLTRLATRGLRLRIEGRQATPVTAPPTIRLPLPLEIDAFSLEDSEVRTGAAPPQRLERIAGELLFNASGLALRQLSLKSAGLELSGSMKLMPAGAYPMHGSLRWRLQHADLPPNSGRVDFSGDLQALRGHIGLLTPSAVEIEWKLAKLLTGPTWKLDLSLPETSLQRLRPGLPAITARLHLQGSGDLEQADFHGDYRARLPQLGMITGPFQARTRDWRTWEIQQLSATLENGGGQAELSGQADLSGASPVMDLRARWSGLSWPPGMKPELRSPHGEAHVTGGIDAYQLALDAGLEAIKLPPVQIRLEASGNQSGLDISRLALAPQRGELIARGRLDWRQGLSWDLTLSGRKLDPSLFRPGLPGDLTLETRLAGSWQGGASTTSVQGFRARGSLRGYAFESRFDGLVSQTRVKVETLEIHSGTSSFSANGILADDSDLSFTLTAPDLQHLLPGLRGSLTASGHLGGKPQAPALTAELSAKKLAGLGAYCASLAGNLGLDLSREAEFRLDLEASDLGYGAVRLEQASLQGQGLTSRHALQLKARGQGRELELRASGGMHALTWRGALEDLQLTGPAIGHWKSEARATVEVSTKAASLHKTCLADTPARVCASGHWTVADGWRVQADAEQIALSRLRAFYPAEVEAQGNLRAAIDLSGRGATPRSGAATVWLGRGALSARVNESLGTAFHFNGGRTDLRLDQHGYHVALNIAIDLPGAAPLEGELNLPLPAREETSLADAPISGRLSAAFTNLSPLQVFIPELDSLKGHLTADLGIAGSLSSPRLSGQARLADGAAGIPRLGIDITAIDIHLHGEPGGVLRLDGKARSGEGKLSLNGTYDPAKDKAGPYRLHLTGDRFEVLRLPEAWVLASPDIDLKLAPEQVVIGGEVRIPEAQLEPLKISMATPPSADIVLVRPRGALPAAPEKRGPRITGSIRVRLGDKVSIEADGFKGRLEGTVVANLTADQTINGVGELRVRDGSYKAYGQDLVIDGGRILFAGGPIEVPALDIRAVRNIDTLQAGVHISGNVDEPRLELYSIPAMPDDQVLAYLMLGRPLDKAKSDEGKLLLQAALALGVQGGEPLTQKLARDFGLDTLSVESGATASATTVRIGKYLSPRVYISYGVGLLEPLGTVKIKYKINKSLSLEASSGTNTGADLFYSIER